MRLRDRGERSGEGDGEARLSVSCCSTGACNGGRLTPATLSPLLAGRTPAAADTCGGTESSGDRDRAGGNHGAGARGCEGRGSICAGGAPEAYGLEGEGCVVDCAPRKTLDPERRLSVGCPEVPLLAPALLPYRGGAGGGGPLKADCGCTPWGCWRQGKKFA